MALEGLKQEQRRTGTSILSKFLLSTSLVAIVAAPLPAEAQSIWTGTVSTDWFTAGNWSPAAVPAAGFVYLGTTAPNPTVLGGATAVISLDALIGYLGDGALTIQNNGKLNSRSGYIGFGTASGTVMVTGAGSSWTNSSLLWVGNTGTGTLTISNGGAVSNTSGLLGVDAGSHGSATVDGAGSIWASSADLYVGQGGTGKLTISNAGEVTNVGGHVGYSAGAVGTATVNGVGSTWTNSAGLTVGHLGTGTLTVSGSGMVSSANGVLGRFSGSTGTAKVDGVGSTWSNSADLTVGLAGTGTLAISSGGNVTNTFGYIGAVVGSNGTVTVDGAGSTWTNSAALGVGYASTGTLTISNGGKVSSAASLVGAVSTGIGAVTVNGVGSTWTNSTDLTVGHLGTGTLTVLNGGTVSSADGVLGSLSGSRGTVKVDGAGSSWSNSADLSVGGTGTGTLAISSGGKVTNVLGYIGTFVGSNGTVTVDGAGSTWANSAALGVGYASTGTLTISNGGKVSSAASLVGAVSTGIGAVTVSGVGSTWTNSTDLTVGHIGAGTLTVSNGGTVSAGGIVTIASLAGSTGTLNIGAAAGSPAIAPGALNAASVQFGAGVGALNFNHTSANYTFASAIGGLGTINQIAGNTNLTANSSGFTGATNVSGGWLVVDGSLANSLVTVSGGGSLGGNGVVGSIAAIGGGVVAPGNSIGTLNVAGNVSFAAGSIYQVEANAAGQSDKIVAGGAATLGGGTVQVLAGLSNYAPSTTYTIVTAAGGVTSGFANVTSNLIFLAPTLSYDLNNVYLTLTRNNTAFESIGQTGNQRATGAAIGTLGLGNPVWNAVVQLDAPSARAAFDQLSGEVHASAKTVTIEDSRFVRDAAVDRLRAAFDSVGAVSMPVMAYAATGPVRAPANTDRVAVWSRGFGAFGQWTGDGNAATIKRDIGGVFIGADSLVAETWRVGMVGGYSRSNFRVADRSSSGASDNYHVGLYGGTQWGDLAFRSGAAYAWHDLSTSRSVAFPGFSDTLKGDYRAYTTQAFGEFGYRIRAGQVAPGNLAFEPFANLAYVNLSTGGFTEKGGAAALTSASSTSGVTFTTVGLRASTGFVLGNGATTTARSTLGWRHAFGDTTPVSTLVLTGGSPFNIAGVPVAVDAAVVDLGLDLNLTANAVLGVAYGGQFGSGLTHQTVRGNFAWKF